MSGLPTTSPDLNVFSIVRPVMRFLMRVRTKAEPLPGFTCWNSRISQGSRSISILRPRRKALVSSVSATALLLGKSVRGWLGRAGAAHRPRAGAGGRLELGLHLGGGHPEDEAGLALVPLGAEGQDHEVLRGDEPGHRR